MLNNVDIIAAEDTRHTLQLLNHLKISKPLISYYKQIERKKSNILIEKLQNGLNIALVSDAGTPGISDPGEEIVKEAINNNITVVPIPGSCALVNALIVSGISTKEFVFIGFLPVNKKEKIEKIEEVKLYKQTIIFYEAPHKLINTLKCLEEILGNREVVIAKEITKIHEEYIRGTLSKVIEKITDPKGEYVIVIEGSKLDKKELQKEALCKLSLDEHYKYYEEKGIEKKDIIKQIAKDRHTNKNEIYQYFVKK